VTELSTEDKRRVHAEQVAMLYGSAGLLVVFNLVNGAVLALVQSLVVPTIQSITWYGALVLVTGLRYVLVRCYRQTQSLAGSASLNPQLWERRFALGVGLSGVVWGATAVVLFPTGETGHQVFLAFILAGMTAGAAATLASRLAMFFAFAVPVLPPLALRFFTEQGSLHMAMGTMTLLFLVGMSLAARGSSQTIRSALVFAYDNDRLKREAEERKQAESALRASEARFRDYAETAADWFWELDDSFRFSFVSGRLLDLAGLSRGCVLGRRAEEVFAQGEQQVAAWRGFETRLRDQPGEHGFEFDWQRPDGEPMTFRLVGRAISDAGTASGRYRGVGRDVTDERRAARLIAHQANHDVLTGLVNRREFMRRLEQALDSSSSSGAAHAFCYLDLDRFKAVNDTVGHAAGDELLRQVTSRLLGRLRQRDTLSRLGGDEFGLLLESCPLERAERIAEDLRSRLEDFRFDWDSQQFGIGVSIGIVPVDADDSAASVLARADRACYAAKRRGRNRIVVQHAHDEAVRPAVADCDRESGASVAGHDRRTLLLHPIYRIDPRGSRDLAGFGLRLPLSGTADAGRTDSPSDGSAASSGNVAGIDPVTLRRALRAFAGFETAPAESFLLVPISDRALSDETLLEHLARQLRELGLKPSRICLMISERLAAERLSQAKHLAEGVRQLGCGFGIEDFGGGVQAGAALMHLPIRFVRLHPALLEERGHGPLRSALLNSARELASAAGAQVIAGLVHEHATLTELADMGFDLCDGPALAGSQAFDLSATAGTGSPRGAG
jgi:diguanylate cyclase (GGDEF)-like protein/PAS domain S-box-containing protein